MFSVAPMSSLGAPMAPVRSRTKHKRTQSQPQPAACAPAVESEGLIALGYHQTEQGAPPVPLIPARSYLRSRSNSSSASAALPSITATEIPPVPPLPSVPVGPTTLKKKPSRLTKNPSAKPPMLSRDIPESPARPPMSSQAPPRPPRPADVDCLLYPPSWQAAPVPPAPTGLVAIAPQAPSRKRHGYSNSTSSMGSSAGSISNSSSVGAPSISTPRQSQESVEFRHVPLSTSFKSETHSRDSSLQSAGFNPQTIEPPSISVFEESSDEEDHLHERGAGGMFRKGGLSLITRTGNKKSSTALGATGSAASGPLHATHEHHHNVSDDARWKLPAGARHSPTSSVPGLSDGSESSELSSTGERTPTDDVLVKRHARSSGHKRSGSKPDHPDEELILMMQSLKTPRKRDSSMRTSRMGHSGVESKSMSLSLVPTSSRDTPYSTFGPMMFQ